MKVNGQDFTFDLFEADTARKFEDGVANILEACEKAAAAERASESIRMQCAAVMDFLDSVLGDGASKAMFGDKTSLTLCLDAFEAVMAEGSRQKAAMERREKKYAAKGKVSGGKMDVGKVSGGKNSVGKVSGGKMDVGKVSGGKNSVGKVSGGKMEVGKVSGGKMEVGKVSGGKMDVGKGNGK